MVHTAVVLPRDLLSQLRTDAERSKRGLSTEIRQRLLVTYNSAAPPRDPQLTEFIEYIETLADSLARDLGKKWHEKKYARAALAEGIYDFLGPYDGTRDIPGHTDPPGPVGRTHGRLIRAARSGAQEADDERKSD
jgi:hypothetical protein